MYLVFDIGGTKMRLAVSENGERFSDPKIIATPQDFEEGIRLFGKIAKEVGGGRNFLKAAGGIAGVFDRGKEKLLKSPNLEGWIGKPLKPRLEEVVGSPTYIENDTAMIGLGEAIYGAGRSYSIAVYITVSTGVGGSRIVDKKIDANVFGFEPGHQIIDADGSLCPGCKNCKIGEAFCDLEGYISGRAMEERYGKKPEDITDEKVWDELARLLAFGLNNTIVHWSPNVVILGGGMMKEGGISIEKVRVYLREILKIFPEQPEIKRAELGDIGGLYGALAYLKQLAD